MAARGYASLDHATPLGIYDNPDRNGTSSDYAVAVVHRTAS